MKKKQVSKLMVSIIAESVYFGINEVVPEYKAAKRMEEIRKMGEFAENHYMPDNLSVQSDIEVMKRGTTLKIRTRVINPTLFTAKKTAP